MKQKSLGQFAHDHWVRMLGEIDGINSWDVLTNGERKEWELNTQAVIREYLKRQIQKKGGKKK